MVELSTRSSPNGLIANPLWRDSSSSIPDFATRLMHDKTMSISAIRVRALVLLAILFLSASVVSGTVRRPVALGAQPVAKPSPQQLAWLDLEMSAMLGFNLQTICAPQSAAGGVTKQPCQARGLHGPIYVPDQAVIRDWDLSGRFR